MLLLSLESPLHVAVHVAGCRGDVAVAAYKWMLNERPRLAGPTPLVKPFCPSKLAPCACKQASPDEVQRERGKEDEMAIMCDRLCGVCVQESAVCRSGQSDYAPNRHTSSGTIEICKLVRPCWYEPDRLMLVSGGR